MTMLAWVRLISDTSFLCALDGMVASIWEILAYLGDVIHSFFHLSIRVASYACHTAARLISSSPSVRKTGRSHAQLVHPLAASFASRSTFSFPLLLLWPFTQPISSLLKSVL